MRPHFLTSIAALAVFPLAAVPCAAQVIHHDDEITVTALRAISPDDVTASVFVIDETALDIRSAPYLADQLRSVPGVGVSRSGANGAVTQIRIRGAEANHTLVLLDGIEVSDPTSGETDFGLWSGLNISRIEVARGEQSVLYGSEAIGGVVALSTGQDDGVSANLEIGTLETARGALGYGQSFDQGRFALAASGFRTDGVDTSGSNGEDDGSQSYSFLASGGLDLSADWSVNALASTRRSDIAFDSDTDFDGLLNNVDRESQGEQQLVGASVMGRTGALDHRFSASYNALDLRNLSDGVFANELSGERKKVSYSPSADITLGQTALTLSAVADWERNDYERVDTDVLFGDPNQSQSFETFGIGGEARARIGKAAFNVSARHDDNKDRFEDVSTWRVGAAYNFDLGARLRASIGTGVKNPTFTELFGFTPASFVGNPDLDPERSQSLEVGFDQSLDILGGPAQASFTYFSAELENEIFSDFSGFPTVTADNRVGSSERSGVEAAMQWQINPAYQLSVSASQIRSDNDSGVDEIRVPQTTASASLSWNSQVKDGLRAGVSADYVGEQFDTNFGTFERVTLDSYTLISASAVYPVGDHLSLTLRGENLLDETVTDVFGYEGAGAGVFAGFTLR